MREPAEAKAGRTFSKFEAKSCATQLVNGINYFVKVSLFLRLKSGVFGDYSDDENITTRVA